MKRPATRAIRPPRGSVLLLAGAFGRCVRLGHLFRQLRFDGFKIETRPFLHRRVIEEGLEFLADDLLDEHKTPELELEPIEVLLPSFFRPIVGPALALKRIEAQVNQVGNVHLRLGTKPAVRLVDETILVVVNAHRADRALAEVEDFVTRGRAFAGNGRRLVITIEMVLVSPVAEFYTLKQLVSDVRVARGCEEGREPVETGEDAVLHGVCRNVSGPAEDARNADATLRH